MTLDEQYPDLPKSIHQTRLNSNGKAYAAKIAAEAETWKCLGPGCNRVTGVRMFCSDECRTKALAAVKRASKAT